MNITGGFGCAVSEDGFSGSPDYPLWQVSAVLSAVPFLTQKRFFMEEEYIQASP